MATSSCRAAPATNHLALRRGPWVDIHVARAYFFSRLPSEEREGEGAHGLVFTFRTVNYQSGAHDSRPSKLTREGVMEFLSLRQPQPPREQSG